MEGTTDPDYASCITISTNAALKEMILPGIMAIVAPVVIGKILGAEALAGMLVGSIASGFLLAVMMTKTGGAWDNTKKFVGQGTCRWKRFLLSHGSRDR